MKTQITATTKTLIRLTAILILTVGLMTTAALAQNKDDGKFAPVGFYTGVQSAEGTLEPITGIRYGNTLVMNSFGEWETYCLTVSLDYATTQFVPNSFIITGGSWSLMVIRDNAYLGTVYGKVSGGDVLVSTNSNGEQIQVTQLNLQATGGLGAFTGKKVVNLSGIGTMTTDLRSGRLQGDVTFNFSRE
jgi:hypothetical protein